jgi:hypothetical protein
LGLAVGKLMFDASPVGYPTASWTRTGHVSYDTVNMARGAGGTMMLLTTPASILVVQQYHQDALGSRRVVTDEAGALGRYHDYHPPTLATSARELRRGPP